MCSRSSAVIPIRLWWFPKPKPSILIANQNHMPNWSLTQLRQLLLIGLLAPLLTGCLLMAGRNEQATITAELGSQNVEFVSSDTNGEAVLQALDIGTLPMLLDVTFNAQVASGELVIEVLSGEQANVAFTVVASAEGSSQRGIVMSNDVGDLQYRVRSTNARNGIYRISYQPPPTPTPTLTPSPTWTLTPSTTPTVEPTAEVTATP
ncbi:hypothetical protein Haur_4163 [Herpetosiphon aurantiacus DSM 785]|uniref:Uncharacterized protein n=2 Tax=Herpetosiphon TaxID=64 RepID=A9AWN6_HERA2|nr:hypothetical protein Haur_4163 [Herpetosiphon aurantiacus DSM 785]